jgi:PAS domain S-box-containing protein
LKDLLTHYFAIGLDVSQAMSPTWSPLLVGVSFIIAVLAGLVFVSLSSRLAEGHAETNRLAWISVGAVIMGLGVWAMHFVGMVAYRLPVPVTYDIFATSLSAVPAIAASAASLHLVARPEISYRRLFIGGLIFGGGIGAMHYTGMAAMDIEGIIRYDPYLFTASVLVAVLLAIAALWVARHQHDADGANRNLWKLGAAILVGFAVAGMHYTAMSSTLCFSGSLGGNRGAIDPDLLASITTIAAMIILLSGIAAILFDRRLAAEITLRKTAALHAAEMDGRLREAIETMQGSLALFDNEDRLVLCNENFKDVYGLSDEMVKDGVGYTDVLRKHVAEKLTHNIRRWGARGAADRLRRAREDELPVSLETRDNTWSTIRQRKTADGGTVFLRTDITRIRETQELLEQQSRRLQLVMDNIADAMVTLDEHGVIESLNRAGERIFGYAENEVIGKHVSVLMASDVELPSGNGMYRYLQGSADDHAGGGERFDLTGSHKNGDTIFLEAAFSDVVEGERRLHIGALRDITERKMTAIALEKAHRAAEQASLAKSEFISHMSHELRTPLNAVIGMSETLLAVRAIREDDSKLTEYLSDILASGNHQLSLVNDVLNLSVIESGGREVHFETFDAVPEISGLISSLQSMASQHESRLHSHLEGREVEVFADTQCFAQVMTNVVSNAILHAGTDSDIRIGVTDSAPAGTTGIYVTDNGVGMPQALIDDLGKPFPQVRNAYVRTPDAPHFGGTGLGYTIIKRLLELNGGRFAVEGNPDGGTRVTLYWRMPEGGSDGARKLA